MNAVMKLPAKATAQITPPPTRAEIIAALVQLRRQDHEEKAAAAKTRRDSAYEQAKSALLTEFKEHPEHFELEGSSFGSMRDNGDFYSMPTTGYKIKVLTPALRKVLKEYHVANESPFIKWGGVAEFNEAKARKEIREKLDAKAGNINRVKLMLDTPAVRSALVAGLKELDR